MTGLNRDFAQHSGININKVIILSISLAGLLSGIAGISEVMGIHRRFNWQMSPGYGWDGVIVAIIGRNHPLAIILSSLFIAYLRVSGQVLNIQSDIPYELIATMQALIILLITAEAFLEGIRFRLILKEAGIKK
jgi:simple sugar transport system permease protein